MANMYHTPATCSSFYPPETTDDISLFLRQILFNSSSSSSSSPSLAAKQTQPLPSSIADRIPALSPPRPANFPANAAAYVSSSSVGTIENDPDDYDGESEEGFENLMEEMEAKQNPPRSSSKRSRAAEVHNLSEKRRRSRINEKMKALQKLIPNSNKTDKASMLDEAIEYLKQLQLQVQMLTMRNGINLYSMCVPTEIHEQNQLTLNQERNPANMTSTFAVNQETLVNPMLGLPAGRSQPSVLDFNPKPSSRHKSSFGVQHGAFQLPSSLKGSAEK